MKTCMICLLYMILATLAFAQPGGIKVILDTDIGDDIDDAWALALVAVHEKLEPLGITMGHGNTPARSKLACKLLHNIDRDDIPVYEGRKTSDHVSYQYVWAEDFEQVKPQPQPAAQFIVETVKKYPGGKTGFRYDPGGLYGRSSGGARGTGENPYDFGGTLQERTLPASTGSNEYFPYGG